MKLLNKILNFLCLSLAFYGCSSAPSDVREVDSLPPLYPDYAGVTVPLNIAPLNFLLRDDCEDMYVTATGGDVTVKAKCRANEAAFDVNSWHKLLKTNAGGDITVEVKARIDGEWIGYRPFSIHVSADSIDPYLTYRLIEPDYEVFSRLQIRERCIEDFSERSICDYNKVGNRCMNCHTYGANRSDLSFLYLRGEGGGMMLNRGGKTTRLTLKTDEMAAGAVYAQFSPSGRYIVFSDNKIIPGFHSKPSRRLEVFDTRSDVYLVDLETMAISTSPVLADSARLETFPTFSPDGRNIYFCVAEAPVRIDALDSLSYSLCRVSFDEATGRCGELADTVLLGVPGEKSSVCHPRLSPDGRFLLYTVADYGTFPIWHTEADQRMLDLHTGEINTLDIVNSDRSDTYHCWSSSGRWFVFASKRDDGLYGKPYFCHIDTDGSASKPFVLPQRSPSFYDTCLKSFNVPELGTAPVYFDL